MNNKNSKNPDIHEGMVVQTLIKESPQTLTGIAMQMGKSRNMLYSRFKLKRLTPSFLFALGKIINIDFKRIFPRLAEDSHYLSLLDEKEVFHDSRATADYRDLQKKYYTLLESYNRLLKFLFRLIKEHGLKAIGKDLKAFIDTETKL